MGFEDLPPAASWEHRGLRVGFEVVYFGGASSGFWIDGTTTGLQDDEVWVVGYELELDRAWRTRSARLRARTGSGVTERFAEADGEGRWVVDGVEAVHLAGCIDVDLESSAMTNTFPVHRLDLGVGSEAGAPAAYFRLDTCTLERLDQTYRRVEDVDGCQQYDYEAPVFDFGCRLVYDRSGLLLDYPGIAVRAS